MNGISQLHSTAIELENFKNYEEFKLSRYLNYQQYGGFGFQVTGASPVLSLFFGGFNHYNYRSSINVKETIDISCPIKGRDFFLTIVNNHDIASLYFLLGTLFMLLGGLNIFVSRRAFLLRKNFKFATLSIVCRLIVLVSVYFVSFLLLFILPYFWGFTYSTIEIIIFFKFLLYLGFNLTIFYFIGVFVVLISGFRPKPASLISLSIWILFIILIPELSKIVLKSNGESLQSNELINMEKSKKLFLFEKSFSEYAKMIKGKDNQKELTLDFIRAHYIETYRSNRLIEDQLKTRISYITDIYEKYCLLIPTVYYYHTSREVSGKGFSQYIDFFDKILRLKDAFFSFYLSNRYEMQNNELKPFCSTNDQIINLKSQLPKSFNFALLIVLGYNFILCSFSLFLIPSRLKIQKGNNKAIEYDLSTGEINFMYFDSPLEKKQVINFFHAEGLEILSPYRPNDFESISISRLLNYYCLLANVNQLDVESFLNIFLTKGGDNSPEIINKLFLAISLSKKCDLVLDDFFKGASEEFEQRFFSLISNLKIIYLSSEMFSTKSTKKTGMISITPEMGISFR